MASEKLSIETSVRGATAAARQIGTIGTAIDKVSAKARGLRGKLGSLGSAAGGFLSSTGLGWTIATEGLSLLADKLRETYEQTQAQSAAATAAVTTTGRDFLKSNPTIEQLNMSIAGIDQGIKDIASNPLNFFAGGGDAVKGLNDLKVEYVKQRDLLAGALNQPTNITSEVNLAVPVAVDVQVNVSGSQRVTYIQRKATQQPYVAPVTQTIPGYTNPWGSGFNWGEG